MMESILDIKENYVDDVSIKSFETYAYQPISGTQLNGAGQITTRIENQDAYFYPRGSWLQIEGKLVKATGAAVYADADDVSLINNGLLYLFENCKYELSGQEIESLYHPGQATTMLGLAKYSKCFNDGPGLNQCWKLDTSTTAADTNTGFKTRHDYIIEKSDPKGSFRFSINLEHIFGFCEDYNKVMYGFVHALTLVRAANSNNAIFKDAEAAAGKVLIEKLSWMMPKLEPNELIKNELYHIISKQETLSVGFRMRQCATVTLPTTQSFTWRLGVRSAPEKPRFMMIAFQTDKNNDQVKNTALFNHCSLINMYILLNNVRYPAIDFNADFAKNEYENLYKNLADFRQGFYGIDYLASNITVDPITFKDLFPVFVFDVSKQSERLQQGVVDITVEMSFGANVTAKTIAYALLISDRKLKFQSDGKKMNVIF